MSEQPAQVVQLRIMSSDSCSYMADAIAQNATFDFKDKIALLNQLNPIRRLEMAVKLLRQELEMLQLEDDILLIVKDDPLGQQRQDKALLFCLTDHSTYIFIFLNYRISHSICDDFHFGNCHYQ